MGGKAFFYQSNAKGLEQPCSHQFLSRERKGLRIFGKGTKPLSSLMLNQGKRELGGKGFTGTTDHLSYSLPTKVGRFLRAAASLTPLARRRHQQAAGTWQNTSS